jgi:hypothetical protein
VSKTAPEAAGAPARTPLPAVASLRVDPERLARMWALEPAERLAAARRGQFTLGEMLRWASRRPQEVPLVAGEFFFIAALSADSESDDDDDGGQGQSMRDPCSLHAQPGCSNPAEIPLEATAARTAPAQWGENFCLARLL